MHYSSGMKAAIFKRILPPNEEAVVAVSRETGVSANTLYNWKKQAAEGMLDLDDSAIRPNDRKPGEKLSLLLESKNLSQEDRGEWLRSRGLHSEHLPQWEQELRDLVTNKERHQRQKINDL